MPSSPMSHDGVPSQSLPFSPEAELSSAEPLLSPPESTEGGKASHHPRFSGLPVLWS